MKTTLNFQFDMSITIFNGENKHKKWPSCSHIEGSDGGCRNKNIDLITYPSSPELMNHYFHVCTPRIDKVLSDWSSALDD